MKVVYHKGCNDGICSAALMAKYMNATDFFECQYGDPFPFDPIGKDVAILDFSFPREELVKINKSANSLIVLDHHKTAKSDCEGLDFAQFNMNKSGAMMTIDMIGQSNVDSKAHLVAQYVQDRDLWAWELHKSKEVSAALASYPRTIDAWLKLLETETDVLITEGESILRYQKNIVKGISERDLTHINISGYRVPLINSTTLISEIGHEACKGQPFAAIYFDVLKECKRVFALRSDDNGVDVSVVAKKYGGGGHKNAAGFTMPFDFNDIQGGLDSA